MVDAITALAAPGSGLLALGTEHYLFGGAGLVTVLAFSGLILAPAVSAYGRAWEKAAAAFLSLFVLAAMVLVGVAIGVALVYYWDEIRSFLGG